MRLTREIGRKAVAVEGAALVSALGTGIVLPFLVVYLHEARGMSLPIAGLVLTVLNGAGGLAAPVAGAAVDRYGAAWVTVGALLLQAAGYITLSSRGGLAPLLTGAVVAGAGRGGIIPSEAALLFEVTPEAQYGRVSALQRVVDNLGLGFGAVVGGTLLGTRVGGSFRVLLIINALTCALYACVVGTLRPRQFMRRVTAADRGSGAEPAWLSREVLTLAAVAAIYAFAGFGLLEGLVPVFARVYLHVEPSLIGVCFFLNTVTVVVLGLPVARRIDSLRRRAAVAAVGVVWAIAWVMLYTAARGPHVLAVTLLFCGLVVFAVGECLLAAALTPMLIERVPKTRRGSTLSLLAISQQFGLMMAPLAGGVALAAIGAITWLGAAGAALGATGATIGLIARGAAGVADD